MRPSSLPTAALAALALGLVSACTAPARAASAEPGKRTFFWLRSIDGFNSIEQLARAASHERATRPPA